MRALIVVSLVVSVAGCSSARQALGFYKHQADKGVTLGGGQPGEGSAPPGSNGSETTAAPASSRTAARTPKQTLPTGLAGDKEHHAYTSDAPK